MRISREDILQAMSHVRPLVPATPQYRWPMLCEALACETLVKHENHAPTGAFKIRGGLNYFGRLAGQAGPRQVVCATRGNHGQSVAMAGALHGFDVTVVVPHGNSSEKNAAMRALGASVVEYGDDFQAAREHASRLAQTHGWHQVPAFHEALIAGVATYALEFLSSASPLDIVYVPVGMGSGLCGMIAARDALGLHTEIVGVVSAHAPAYARAFASGIETEAPADTLLADGLACRRTDPAALAMIRRGASRFVMVTDDEIANAMRLLFATTHNVAEGAGAASLAAALQERPALRGRRAGIVITGGNVDTHTFAAVLGQNRPFAKAA
ncbi:threonine dehydratase [Niveibacterium microcysteis]|uniref:Threonine dehydratase n=1 Tax=Niveibacterium microcysteis TaxID=2811415 RepID=A0ABX7M0F2_9RHOO|nr:threonine dehydratase [Niveibacterium microcysteis]QSI75246.1 threonine dehydratase [Niveibacterium microcysteis]